jgi:hypothetical protein
MIPMTSRRQFLAALLGAALGLTAAAPGCADGLSEVRAALARLNGREPVRATIEVQLYSETKEDGKPRPEQGKGTVRVEDGPEGLRVTYPSALLERGAQEARQHRADPEKTSPTEAVLREINATDLAEALSFAGPLTTRISRAKLLEERPEALAGVASVAGVAGRPAKLVILGLDLAVAQVERKHIKESSVALKLWLGPDGVPLAAESTTRIKAGFLFLTFTTENRERWDLARVGNRLVVNRRHQETSGAGLGQEFHRKVTEVVNVEGK